jgi:hypothetical protein
MKKNLITALFCFLLLAFISSSTSGIVFVRGGATAVAGCDDCSGDRKFSWHFENDLTITNGTPCGCVDSSGDDTASVTNQATFSTTQESDGTYSGYYVTGVDYHYFTISSRDIFHEDEGKLVFDLYVDVFVSGEDILRIWPSGDASNEITFYISGTDSNMSVYVKNQGSGGSNNLLFGGSKEDDEWLRVTYCATAGPSDDIDAWDAAPTELMIGLRESGGATIFIDNFHIFATSGL